MGVAAGALGLASSGLLAAEIMLDVDQDAYAYAKETLTTEVDGEDEKTYYSVTAENNTSWDVVGKVGLNLLMEDLVTVEYEFRNMVFMAPLAVRALTAGGGFGTFTRRSGGDMGENSVLFTARATGDVIGDDVDLTLNLGTAVAVSPNAPMSVKMTVTLLGQLAGLVAPHVSSNAAAIMVAEALMEAPTPMDATASVAERFMKFVGVQSATLSASLGTFEASIDTTVGTALRDADDGSELQALMDVIMIAGIEEGDPASMFLIEGEFAFADKVTLSAASDCVGGVDLLQRDEDDIDIVTDTRVLKMVDHVAINGMHLCIHVPDPDEEDVMGVVIPVTQPYTVTATYVGLTNAAFPPGMSTHNLGEIMHDGTTIRIPYVTTYEGYNQRIVITNHGLEADYQIMFTSEDGVTATPGSDASGTLAADSTTILSLRKGDVVMIDGGTRTSAELVIDAKASNIEVAVTQVNIETGSTDTSYPPEMSPDN